MDEGIVHLGNVSHSSILEQNVNPFIAGVVCCVDRLAGENKIIGFLKAYSKVCSRFLSLFLN